MLEGGLDSCCGLRFISGVRRNRTEFDYCGLFGSASAVVKPNPLSNIIFYIITLSIADII
jgi:hypothetical protein